MSQQIVDTYVPRDPSTWLGKTYTEEHKKQLISALAHKYLDEGKDPAKQKKEKISIRSMLEYLKDEHDDWMHVKPEQMKTTNKCINGMNICLPRCQLLVDELKNIMEGIKNMRELDEQESIKEDESSQSFIKTDDQQQKEVQAQMAQEKEGSFRLTPPIQSQPSKVFGLVNAPSTTSSGLGQRRECPDIGSLFLINFEEVRKAQDAVKRAKTELEKAFAEEKEAQTKFLTAIQEQALVGKEEEQE